MSRFMRDLATGGASCEPADGAGPSGQTQNPIARVANVVLGDRGGAAREQQMQAVRASGECRRARSFARSARRAARSFD